MDAKVSTKTKTKTKKFQNLIKNCPLGSLTNACCKDNCGNVDIGRMGNNVDAFETLAFGVCNTDGIEGLSWDEVDQCEVSKHEYDFQSFNILALLKYAGPALICEGGLVCFSRFYWRFLA